MLATRQDDIAGHELTPKTEVAYLNAHGVRLARLHYEDDAGVAAIAGESLHVLLQVPDHLGSTSIVIDKNSSELVEAGSYTASGAAETDHRPGKWKHFREDYRSTGKEDDLEAGIQYFGKRFFLPALGRWLTPDPLAVHAPGQADLNLYAYVHGQLLRATDPVGLDLEKDGSPGPAKGASNAEGGVAATVDDAISRTPEDSARGYDENEQASKASPQESSASKANTGSNVGGPAGTRDIFEEPKVLAKAGAALGSMAVARSCPQCAVGMGAFRLATGVKDHSDASMPAMFEGATGMMGGLMASNSPASAAGHIGASGQPSKGSPFNPGHVPGVDKNCVNTVCAYVQSFVQKSVVVARKEADANGGLMARAVGQIEARTGAVAGSPVANSLATGREQQLFIVFKGTNRTVSDHVVVGLTTGGRSIIYDAQSGTKYMNPSDFGPFIAYPLKLPPP